MYLSEDIIYSFDLLLVAGLFSGISQLQISCKLNFNCISNVRNLEQNHKTASAFCCQLNFDSVEYFQFSPHNESLNF